tara:strand:+ start:396 stop:641 length:246 start_codon:yes stop_codon:yes gene_type:complete
MNTNTPEFEFMQLRVSGTRDNICEWVMDRFRVLIAEERVDDAIAFADEWFEWMDPDNYINESTQFYDEYELKEFYESITNR